MKPDEKIITLRNALRLLLNRIRLVRRDESPERMIPAQHAVKDILQAYNALRETDEDEYES